MTDTVTLAKKYGAVFSGAGIFFLRHKDLEAFRAECVREEREACATICHEKFMSIKHGEQTDDPYDDMINMEKYSVAEELAKSIRARSDAPILDDYRDISEISKEQEAKHPEAFARAREKIADAARSDASGAQPVSGYTVEIKPFHEILAAETHHGPNEGSTTTAPEGGE